MSRRSLVAMSEDEVEVFLRGSHSMSLATHGPNGWPHVVAMWYGFVGDELALWAYPRSQKVRNIQRDDRVTCLVEIGDTYDTLQGVEIQGHAGILEDPEEVVAVGRSIEHRYTGANKPSGLQVEEQAARRVAIRIKVERMASWDHRKLGGSY